LQSTSSLITALGNAPLSWLLVTTGVGKVRVCTAVIFQIDVGCLCFLKILRVFNSIYGFPIDTLLYVHAAYQAEGTYLSGTGS
jgi:hypothetical protein